MDERNHKLAHSQFLNHVYEERTKLLTMAGSLLVDRDAAEQVFNELVVALQNRDEDFVSVKQLHAWAWKGMRNRCLNLVERKNLRSTRLDDALSAQLDKELAQRPAHELGDWAETMQPCLAELTPAARWIVQLRYLNRHRSLEVARLTGRNPVAIYGDLQKIYVALNNCLRKRVAMGLVMSGPSTEREFQRLVFRYLDDQLTLPMAEQLHDLLWESAARRQEFNDIRVHTALLYEFAAQVAPGDEHALVFPQPVTRKTGLNWTISITVTVLLVTSVIAMLSRLPNRAGSEPQSPVSFVSGANAEFGSGSSPSSNGAMEAGSYNLKKGQVQLRMASGAALNMEGPANFDVVSEDQIDLHNGTVTALVPEQAVGFVVDTPLGKIRDLGTEFGVVVNNSQSVDVVVFNGRVEVEREGLPVEPLEAGEGLRLTSKKSDKALQARNEAYRFPMQMAVTAPQREGNNLILNPSFEIGTLSRAPHMGRHYRDVPSGWEAGRYFDDVWQPVAAKAVGTVAGATRWTHYPTPAHGERYVYLDGGQYRQEVGPLKAGVTYELTVSLAALRSDLAKVGVGSYQFGLWAGDSWIAQEFGQLNRNEQQFKDRKLSLRVEKGNLLAAAGSPLIVVLSGDEMVFCDNVRLTCTPN